MSHLVLSCLVFSMQMLTADTKLQPLTSCIFIVSLSTGQVGTAFNSLDQKKSHVNLQKI